MLKLDLDGIRYRLALAKDATTSTEMATAGRNWARVYSKDVRALRACVNRLRSLVDGTDTQLLDILRQMDEAPSGDDAEAIARRRLRSLLAIPPDAPLPDRPLKVKL